MIALVCRLAFSTGRAGHVLCSGDGGFLFGGDGGVLCGGDGDVPCAGDLCCVDGGVLCSENLWWTEFLVRI